MVILLTAIFTGGLIKPAFLQKLMEIKLIYGIVFVGFLILTIINFLLYNSADDENADYGKNINNKDEILNAKKDLLIRTGIFFTIIGFLCLGFVLQRIFSLS